MYINEKMPDGSHRVISNTTQKIVCTIERQGNHFNRGMIRVYVKWADMSWVRDLLPAGRWEWNNHDERWECMLLSGHYADNDKYTELLNKIADAVAASINKARP